MTALTNQAVKDSYNGLLQVPSGISGSLTSVEDGLGTQSVLQLSSSGINVNASSISVNSHPLTVSGTSSISGTNTGDQTITLTGNVTGSGVGSFATTIGAGVVTNSMLTGSIAASKLVGTDISTLGTINSGVWNGTNVALANGGSGASLIASTGGIVYSGSSALAILSGTATANKILLSGPSSAPTWSTSTIPSSSGATANKVLLSDGTNYVLSTPTFPNSSVTSGKIIKSDGTNWVASTETYASPGTSGNIMTSNGTNWVSSPPVSGAVIQKVRTITGAVATGSTIVPFDDTIPQNTEGDQYMSLAITPTNSSNTLEVTVTFQYAIATSIVANIISVFQDSTANAKFTCVDAPGGTDRIESVSFTGSFTAGTTSSTTIKVRAGNGAGNTMTFNGVTGSRQFGGALCSSITITECSP